MNQSPLDQARPLAAGICLLAAVLTPGPARAEAVYTVTGSARAIAMHDFGRGDPVMDSQPHPVSISSSDFRGSGTDSGSARARASSSLGLLQVHAEAQASASGMPDSFVGNAGGHSSAMAWQSDSFAITAAGCSSCSTGSLGRLTFALRIDGAASSSAQASGTGDYELLGNWDGSLSLDTGALGSTPLPTQLQASTWSSFQDLNGVASSSQGGLGNGLHIFSVSFAFGTDIQLDWSAQATVDAYLRPTDGTAVMQGQASSVVDLSRGLAWAGILSVLDANGQAVDGFSALNSGGLSYAQSFASAVPEPGQWLLMGAGLLALAALARRRDTRP